MKSTCKVFMSVALIALVAVCIFAIAPQSDAVSNESEFDTKWAEITDSAETTPDGKFQYKSVLENKDNDVRYFIKSADGTGKFEVLSQSEVYYPKPWYVTASVVWMNSDDKSKCPIFMNPVEMRQPSMYPGCDFTGYYGVYLFGGDWFLKGDFDKEKLGLNGVICCTDYITISEFNSTTGDIPVTIYMTQKNSASISSGNVSVYVTGDGNGISNGGGNPGYVGVSWRTNITGSIVLSKEIYMKMLADEKLHPNIKVIVQIEPCSETFIDAGDGSYIYTGSKDIESITVPSNITKIGQLSFAKCSKLRTVTFEGAITDIGNSAFFGCNSLVMSIPSTVKTIGDYAFKDCEAIETLDIPEGVEFIGKYAFSECKSLKTVTIPGTVKSIGESAFSKYYSDEAILTSVVFKDSNTPLAIESSAFQSQTAITDILLPYRLQAINGSIFSSCNGLKTIGFTQGDYQLEVVQKWAFNNLKIEKLSLPMAKIKDFEFFGYLPDAELIFLTENPNLVLIEGIYYQKTSDGEMSPVKIPKEMTGVYTIPDGVTIIGSQDFRNKGITGLVIPASLKVIESDAFSSCPIESIVFKDGSSLSTIGKSALRGTNLTSITLPASVKQLGQDAFAFSRLLESVVVSGSDLTFDTGAFRGCSKMTSFVFADANASLVLGNTVFSNTLLDHIDLPSGTTKLGMKVFDGSNITEIYIPASVTEIFCSEPTYFPGTVVTSFSNKFVKVDIDDKNPSYYDKDGVIYKKGADGDKLIFVLYNVTDVVIPESVTEVAIGAFANHTVLKTVTYGANVTSKIHEKQFSGCDVITSVLLDKSKVVAVDKYAFEKTVVEVITLPATVQTIGYGAFSGCEQLRSLTFVTENSLLTSVGSAFSGCTSLKSLALPDTITMENLGDSLRSFTLSELSLVKVAKSPVYYMNEDNTILFHDDGSKCIQYILPTFSVNSEDHGRVLNVAADIASIDSSVFMGSPIDWIEVDANNAVYSSFNGALFDKNQTVLYYVPEGVESLTLPATVTSISNTDWNSTLKNAVNLQKLTWISESDLAVASVQAPYLENLTISTVGNVVFNRGFEKCDSIKNVVINANSIKGTICNGESGYSLEISVKDIENKPRIPANARNVVIDCDALTDVSTFFGFGSYKNLSLVLNGDVYDPVKSLLGHSVRIKTDIDGFQKNIEEIHKGWGSGYVIYSFDSKEMLTLQDIVVTGGTVVKNGVKINISKEDVVITIQEKPVTEFVNVSFDVNGGVLPEELKTLKSGMGRTIYASAMDLRSSTIYRPGHTFEGWYLDAMLSKPYVVDVLEEDIVLFARWSVNDGIKVTYDEGSDLLKCFREDGTLFYNGENVYDGEVLKFVFNGGKGVDLFGWNVNIAGVNTFTASKETELEVPITDVTYVSSENRCFATSSTLIDITSLPTAPGANIEILWEKQFKIDASMNIWTGFPSIPVIVDDRVYVRAANDLMMIDLDTGSVLKVITTPGSTPVAYYHYLGYGDGVIVDYITAKAYDLDLNLLYELPCTCFGVNDDEHGYFIGITSNGLIRFNIADGTVYKEGGWSKAIPSHWHGLYGGMSGPVIIGDWMYYIEISGEDSEGRGISAINVVTGETDKIVFERINNHLLDDGWLTHYEYAGKDYLFLTSYTNGMSGSVDSKNPRGCVTSIQVGDDGKFIPSSERWIDVDHSSALSSMIVIDNRGYLYGAGLYVFDMKSFFDKPDSYWDVNNPDYTGDANKKNNFLIYKESNGPESHGSIVACDSYKDETGNVYLYVLPYSSGQQALYTFTDWDGKTTPTGYQKSKPVGDGYGSQAVRAGHNGELVWYTDSGTLWCVRPVADHTFDFIIQDENGVNRVSVKNQNIDAALADALAQVYLRTGAHINGLAVNGVTPTVYSVKDTILAIELIEGAKSFSGTYLVSFTEMNAPGTALDLDAVDDLYYLNVDGINKPFTLESILNYPPIDGMFVKNLRPVTEVDLGDDFAVDIGEEGVIIPLITPGNAVVSGVTWSVDDSDVAVIDQNGSITFLKAGTVVITATAVDGSGVTGTCTVTVRDAAFGIEIDSDSATVEKDKTVQLQASMMPADATGYVMIWDSSDDAVATVDQNGKVTGLKAGTAVISVAAEGTDLIAYCMVSVTDTVSETDTSKDDKGNTTETTTDRIDAGNGTTVEKVTETVTDSDGKVQSEKVTMTVKTDGSDVQTQVVLSTAGGASSADVVTELPVSTVPGKVPVADVTSEALGIAMKQIIAAQSTAGDSAVRSTVTVKVSVGDADGMKVRMPASAVEALSEATGSDVCIESDRGTILLSGDVMDSLSFAADGSIEFSMDKKGASGLTEAQSALVEDASVYQLTAAADGTSVHQLGGTATVSVPFQVADGKSLSDLIVYHIEDDGTLSKVFFVYDRDTETLSFMTTHFSDFVVGYDATAPEVVIDNGSFEQTITVCIAIIMGLVIVIGVLGMMFYTRTKTQ